MIWVLLFIALCCCACYKPERDPLDTYDPTRPRCPDSPATNHCVIVVREKDDDEREWEEWKDHNP